MISEDSAESLFVDAVKLAAGDFYLDATHKFTEIAHRFRESPLADDALMNAGLCYFHLNLFKQAIAMFEKVIIEYPDGDIYTFGDYQEFGKTAAKCHYALVNCYLGMAHIEEAANEIEKLKAYPDSYILSALGEKLTFLELAEKAFKTYSQLNIN